MFELRKLLGRDAGRSDRDTLVDASMPRGEGLEAEYETLIVGQCKRWGIAEDAITIEVRRVGRGQDGREIYLGMLRLARWDRNSALRLMLGQPILENKIRRMVGNLWLAEVSHFGGLWLHASEQVQQLPEATRELRQLMMQLTPEGGSDADAGYEDAVNSAMAPLGGPRDDPARR